MTIDTIAAIATPPGQGGVGILRISGPQVAAIGQAVVGRLLIARQAHYARFKDAAGEVLDQGLALLFTAPDSYTGEDVLELHGHGSPVVLDLLLQRVLQLGARLARPGEFTERAFLNNKLDLAQAEAVADLIESGSEQAARAAIKSLQGEFSKHIDRLVESLTHLRVYIEAALDFPDEEIDFLADGKIITQLQQLELQLQTTLRSAQQGALLKEGLTVVIAGRPNVGKSSLINQLAGYEAAIVTPVAGTTRDLVREHIHLDGLPLHIIDTAGLHDTEDLVEQEGIRRTWKQLETADRVLLVLDAASGLGAEEQAILQALPAKLPVDVVHNKIDLLPNRPESQPQHCYLSAKTGEGMVELRQHLKASVAYDAEASGRLSARRRHLDALERALSLVTTARHTLQDTGSGELVAEDLKQAQQVLGEITGQVSSDDLLGKIFSSFCIGK